MSFKAWYLVVLLAICFLTATLEAQQSTPLGGDFQVNGYTTGYQLFPAIAASFDGQFVVTWMSYSSPEDDNSQTSVLVRQFAADASPKGLDMQANTYITSRQEHPAVAMDGSGAFVVAWSSNGSSGTDLSGSSIQARRFNSFGVPLSNDFQVNTSAMGDQAYPTVAAADDGRFVIVWQSDSSAGSDTQGYSIQGQLFASNGAPVGDELQLNQHTPLDQTHAAVAMNLDGRFIVVWTSGSSPGDDNSLSSVQGRRFDAAGSALDDQFQVNQGTSGNQNQPQVDLASNGDFAVTWKSQDTPSDAEGAILARRYRASGAAHGTEFQANAYTFEDQLAPGIAIDPDGDLVVTWESSYADNGDSFRSIQGRRFAADGEVLGTQFLINSFTPSAQFLPVVASRGEGDFVVAWNSGQSPGDDVSYSILARRFGPDSDGDGITDDDDLCFGANGSGDGDSDGVCADRDCNDADGGVGLPDECGVCGGGGACLLLHDGFEKGDTSAWSSAQP